MAEPSFGNFPSFDAFLNSLEAARRKEQEAAVQEAVGEEGRKRRKSRPPREPRPRNVAEVQAVLRLREEDDVRAPKHYHLLITVNEILSASLAVEKDVERVQGTGDDVFVAIRFGDRMGIMEPVQGLVAGAMLHLKGEWISQKEATAHGGRNLSVLHFTHDPLGFTCVGEPQVCYS